MFRATGQGAHDMLRRRRKGVLAPSSSTTAKRRYGQLSTLIWDAMVCHDMFGDHDLLPSNAQARSEVYHDSLQDHELDRILVTWFVNYTFHH